MPPRRPDNARTSPTTGPALATNLPTAALDAPMRVLAGPGTGKTQALVELYGRLVEEGSAGRGEILVLTFSTAAAGELAARIDSRLGDSYDQAWISTFHSFCARLLRMHRPDPGRLLMSGFQEWVAMRRTLNEIDRSLLGRLGRVALSDGFARDALAFVALLKQNRVHPAEFALLAETSGTARLRSLGAVYTTYQARLQAASLRDFRDLVTDAIALLEGRPQVLDGLRRRFRHVLVDEFQDVDPAQFHLLQLVAPPPAARLLVVGDPDQSIYGFRGSVPGLLSEDFPRLYGDRSSELAESHRCPPAVLAAAGRLLAATQPRRPPRSLTSARPELGQPSLRVAREANAVDEAFFTAREIRRLMLEDPGLRAADFAVLLRSTTTHSAPFEEAIRALGLASEVRGASALARNEAVRFLLTFLHAVDRPDDPESLQRLLASGLSGVGRRTAGRLRRYAIEEGRSLTRVVRRLMYRLRDSDPAGHPLPWGEPAATDSPPDPASPPPDFVGFMSPAELVSLHAALTAFHAVSRLARRLPLRALAHSILVEGGVMERLLRLPVAEADRDQALGGLRVALEAFAELEAVWERLHGAPPMLSDVTPRLDSWIGQAVDEAAATPGQRDAVQILTVHQSKGLQFEVVFLSGFAQGVFPPAARPHPVLEAEDQRWLERSLQGFRPSWASDAAEHSAEEARLAYVGMTRARRILYLTHADEYEVRSGPSPFLAPAGAGAPVTSLTRSGLQVDADSLLTLGEAETLLAGLPGAGSESRLAELGVDLAFIADPESGRPFEPQEQRPEGVVPGHFSATALNDYLKCPRLYWYNHHPGLASPPRGVELERGSFLHRVLEDFHAREAEWRPLPNEVQKQWLEAALDQHLDGYLNRVEAVLERRAEEQEVRRILGNYIRFATSAQVIRRLGTLMTEMKFTLEVDGSQVRGKIDRVNDTGEGTVEIVDYKTGRGYGAQRAFASYFGPELHDVQLVMYYLACREGIDDEGRPIALQPRYLSIWYPKDWVYGSIRQVLFPLGGPVPGLREQLQRPVAAEDLARGRERVAGAIRSILEGDFRPRPRPDAIGTCLSWFGCPHSAICPFGGQPSE